MRQVNVSPAEEYEGRLAAALALRQIGDFWDALRQLRRAAELKPEDGQAALLFGLTLQDLDQLPAAEKELRRACKLAPESVEARLALGMLLLARGKHIAATTCLKPIAADVHNTSARRAYADALAQTPRGIPRAIALLEESLAHEPQDEELAIQLAELLQKKGNHQRTVTVLGPLAEQASSADLLRLLSDSYGKIGQVARSLETARRAAELAPGRLDLWLNLAVYASQTRKADEAIYAASKAVELDDPSPAAWLALALAHTTRENWAQALSAQDQAIRLAEQWKFDTQIMRTLRSYRVGVMWRAQGVDAALAQVAADLALDPDSEELRKLQADLLSTK